MDVGGGGAGLGGAVAAREADLLAHRAHGHRLDAVAGALAQRRAAVLEDADAAEEGAGQRLVRLKLTGQQVPARGDHVVIGRGDLMQVADGLAKPTGGGLAGVDEVGAATLQHHLQDRVGAQAVAPGGLVDHHRRFGVIVAGGDLGGGDGDRGVGADHRLRLAGGAGGEQQLGDVAAFGDGVHRRGAQQPAQGDVAGAGVAAGDHRQAGQEVGVQRAGERGGVVGVDRAGLQHRHRVGQTREVGSGQAVLRRHRGDRHAQAHGRERQQRVVDAVAGQDQHRRRPHDPRRRQPAGQRADLLTGLAVSDGAPAVAGPLGQPHPLRRLARPALQRSQRGVEGASDRRRVEQDQRPVISPRDLQPAGGVAGVADAGGGGGAVHAAPYRAPGGWVQSDCGCQGMRGLCYRGPQGDCHERIPHA